MNKSPSLCQGMADGGAGRTWASALDVENLRPLSLRATNPSKGLMPQSISQDAIGSQVNSDIDDQ